MRAIRGNSTDAVVGFSVLSADGLRNHPAAKSITGPVIYWSSGERTSGSSPGEHDGIRDGSNSGHLKTETIRFYYCSLQDFVAGGMTPALREWLDYGKPTLERDFGSYRYKTGQTIGKLWGRLSHGEKQIADIL